MNKSTEKRGRTYSSYSVISIDNSALKFVFTILFFSKEYLYLNLIIFFKIFPFYLWKNNNNHNQNYNHIYNNTYRPNTVEKPQPFHIGML